MKLLHSEKDVVGHINVVCYFLPGQEYYSKILCNIRSLSNLLLTCPYVLLFSINFCIKMISEIVVEEPTTEWGIKLLE